MSLIDERTIAARVMIVNGASSPFGAGWDIADLESAKIQSDGVMISSGDGSVSFFETCTGTCQLTSPPGDFSTVNRVASGLYERRYPDGTRYLFDVSGKLTSTVDRFGYGTTITRNGSGQITALTDPAGYAITIAYTSGKLASVTTPGTGGTSRTSEFVVNGSGDLIEAKDPDNIHYFRSATYSSHRLSSLLDRRSKQWDYSYADDGGLRHTDAPPIAASGQPSTRPRTTVAGPSREILTRIALGTQGSSSNPVSRGLDLRASITNPRGNMTSFAVNRWGSPTRTSYPLGLTDSTTYNGVGQVTQTIGSSGNTVNYTWNGVQLTSAQDMSTGRTMSMTYESTYNRVLTVSGNTVAKTFTYPDLRTMTAQTGIHPVTTIKLDTYGRDSVITDGGGHQTFSYRKTTLLRNLDSVRTAGRVTHSRHDSYGRIVAMVRPDLGRDSVMYDALNRVIKTINPLNHTTTLAYGDSVFLTSVTDANSQVTSYVRNALGWVESEYRAGSSNPLATWYDRNGNPDSTKNRRLQVVRFGYDALDRIVSRDADGASITYGIPTASTHGYVRSQNGESTDSLVLSAAGRLVRGVRSMAGHTYTLAYGYNTNGLLSSIAATSSTGAWSGTKTQSFGYTATEALDSFTNWAGTTALNPGTGNEDLPTSIAYPNGVTISRGYGALHVGHSNSYDVTALEQSFGTRTTFDGAGRVGDITFNNNARRYFYDGARQLQAEERWTLDSHSCSDNQIIGADCTWTNPSLLSDTAFTYDAAGNRMNSVTQLDVPGNRVRAANGFSFDYDADGNLISKSGSGFSQSLAWNALGQLTSVTTNGSTVTFGYSADGSRVRKTVDGTTTRFVHNGDDLFMQVNASGSPTIEYSFWSLDKPHSMLSNGQTYYFHTDPAGNVRGVTRSSDNMTVAAFIYRPFGQPESTFDTLGVNLRFAGREYDAQTQLYYNRARYYDPLIGRFISEDPIGLDGGTNLYAYGANDPVNARDPYGMCPYGETEKITFNRNEDGDWIEERLCLKGGSDRWYVESTTIWGNGHPLASFLALQGFLNGVGDVSGINDLGRGALSILAGDLASGALSLAMALPMGRGGKAINSIRRFTPDQAALVALAKRARVTGGLNSSETAIMKEWAQEYGMLFRGPEAHPGRLFGQFPHVHVGPVNHIPFRP